MVGSNLVLIVSVIIFISSALIIKEGDVLSVSMEKVQNQVQPFPSPESSELPVPTATPSVQFSPKPTPKPIIPSPNPTPVNNTTPNTNASLSGFIYPNSNEISSLGGVVILQSSDSPQVITDWYKTKIKEQGMNTTSFVTTSTNGNVLNKLAGAKNNQSIEITITKSSFDSKTKIEISNLYP